MYYNKYEWQLTFNTDGVDAECVKNPDSDNASVIEHLPISDDPKISWPAAQEEAKSILRMKCTRDILKTTWDDLQAAIYAVSNQKWLDSKMIDAARRRWPSSKLAEQWLILGAIAVNNTTYKKLLEKLLSPTEDLETYRVWHNLPGDLSVQLATGVSYLYSLTENKENKFYVLPDVNKLYSFNGYCLNKTVWKKPSGEDDVWEIWAADGKFLIRNALRNGLMETRFPLKKSLSAIDVVTSLEENWHIHSRHAKLKERIETLASVAKLVGLDNYTILSKLWNSDVASVSGLLKVLYPEKDQAWLENITIQKTAFEAITAIKELDQST